MIEKIVSIKRVGIYHNCSPCGDVSFRDITLLYGENGKGKTTLCSILRSLRDNNPALVLDRRTLGSNDTPQINIRLNSSTVTFAQNAWSSAFSDFCIFDSDFIHDNVHSGDAVGADHKKNLHRVIIGATGVQLARQIDKLDAQIREVNAEIKPLKSVLEAKLPKGENLDAYLRWDPIAKIDEMIHEKSTVLVREEKARERADEISAKPSFKTITQLDFPPQALQLLAKQLPDIALDAEEKVQAQIAAHNMGHDGESWLSNGLRYVTDKTCPFCSSTLDPNGLITAYQSHFNAAYKRLKSEVAQLSSQISTAIGDTSLMALQRVLSSNTALWDFWRQFLELPAPEIDFDEIHRICSLLQRAALDLVARKEQSPIQSVLPDREVTELLNSLIGLGKLFRSYNDMVNQSNERIARYRSEARDSTLLTGLRTEVELIRANRDRFQSETSSACQTLLEAFAKKATLDASKESAKKALDLYSQDVLAKYETAINRILDQFGTGFNIINTKHDYRGGTPRSLYQIQINNEAFDTGDDASPGPRFKTALSAGDRSALALAFFLVSLEHESNIASKILVFDDPFTSQDRFRRTCTQQLICKYASAARQTIILSHDPYFLELIWKHKGERKIRSLQLFPKGNGTEIGPWDIEHDTRSEYLSDYSVLLQFYRDREGEPIDVVRAIRPLLEGLFRTRFPGHFKNEHWLGDFLEKIRLSDDPTDGLAPLKAELLELTEINDYSKKYHHSSGSDDRGGRISADELYTYVKRTLRFVGHT